MRISGVEYYESKKAPPFNTFFYKNKDKFNGDLIYCVYGNYDLSLSMLSNICKKTTFFAL